MSFKIGHHIIDKYTLIEALALTIIAKEKLEKLLTEELEKEKNALLLPKNHHP